MSGSAGEPGIGTRDLLRDLVIVSAVNHGYVSMAMNWLASVREVGVADRVRMYALEAAARDELEARGVECELWEAGADDDELAALAEFRSPAWNRMMFARMEIVRSILETGRPVLFSDCDVVFLRDPLPDLAERVEREGWDLLFQSDWGGDYDTLHRICPGFYLARPGDAVIELLRPSGPEAEGSDQHYFNTRLDGGRSTAYRVGTLPLDLYPNGRYWSRKKEHARDTALAVHYNWVKGFDVKRRLMVEDGVWRVGGVSPAEDPAGAGSGPVGLIARGLRRVAGWLDGGGR